MDVGGTEERIRVVEELEVSHEVARMYMTFFIQTDTGTTIFFAIAALAFDRDASWGAVKARFRWTLNAGAVVLSTANEIIVGSVVHRVCNGGCNANEKSKGGDYEVREHNENL